MVGALWWRSASAVVLRERSQVIGRVVDIGDMSKGIGRSKENARLPDTLADAGYDGKLDPWGRPAVLQPAHFPATGRRDKSWHP